MSINVTFTGRVAFDPRLGKSGRSATLCVNVPRNYKPENEKYYPTDIMYCKAITEQRAKMVMERFSKGDVVVVEGVLQKGDDYTKKETNELVKGEWECIINHIDGPYTRKDTKNNDGSTNLGSLVIPTANTGGLPIPDAVPSPVAGLPQANSLPPMPNGLPPIPSGLPPIGAAAVANK